MTKREKTNRKIGKYKNHLPKKKPEEEKKRRQEREREKRGKNMQKIGEKGDVTDMTDLKTRLTSKGGCNVIHDSFTYG